MTSDNDNNVKPAPPPDGGSSALTEKQTTKRPAVDDVRAVVLAVYRDPARFKPLTQASSPVPAGFIDLLTQLLGGRGAFSNAAGKNAGAASSRAELTQAAWSYLEKVMLADPENYYRILGLAMDASAQEVQKSYSTLRRFISHCGQRAGTGRATDLISRAYVTLNDSLRRREYDRELVRGKPEKP